MMGLEARLLPKLVTDETGLVETNVEEFAIQLQMELRKAHDRVL